MTLDQLSNLVKDPKLFGIFDRSTVRPAAAVAVQHRAELRYRRYLFAAAGKAGLHPADHQRARRVMHIAMRRDERRAPAAAEECANNPRRS